MPTLNQSEIDDALDKYMPLAVTVAKRYQRKLPPGIDEKQDLIQEASLGLFQCLHRYDPARGPLTPWVTQHINGAIRDYLRKRDPFPQEVREKVKSLKAAEETLWKDLQGEPTSRELADQLKVSIREVDKLKQWLEIWSLSSLDDPAFSPQLTPTTTEVEAEADTAINQSWNQLMEQEKVAVRMHVDGATMEDIAQALGVSRATAHRILQRALERLAKALAPEDHDGE